MKLTDPIQMVKGVGPKNSTLLKSIGIQTVEDLLNYWPRRYDDYSMSTSIANLEPGLVSVRGEFSAVSSRRSRRGMHMTEATMRDATGALHVVWFNQPYRAMSTKKNVEYVVMGEFGLHAGKLSIVNPRIELAKDLETGGTILAVYKESKNVTSTLLRKVVLSAISAVDQLRETLPGWVVAEADVIERSQAVRWIHKPTTTNELEKAQDRLGFEEVFQMQVASALARKDLLKEHSPRITFEERIAKEFVSHLPFDLTPDQRKTVWQIYKDMDKDTPMNRLVEGDVGSGKTVVAAMAAVMAMQAGYQVLFMAPTEILARQHAHNLAKLLEHTEWADSIGLLVGGLSSAQKKSLHAQIASGACRLAVGTNALIQDKVATQNVGLVIVDEQHRFGVEQRTKLRTKAGLFPHVLCMTATPIPRTLALTLYGELDVTQLKSMPSGRKPVDTEVVEATSKTRVYEFIEKKLSEGRQAFIVCPLIEESEMLQATSVEKLYETLSKGYFKHRKVALMHGGMKPDDKQAVMQRFKDGEIELLITTTVIEVGVDVPNASVMVIESAERFGLAQIHQLRGRVGRGMHEGYCFLIPSEGQPISKRLRVLSYVTDGFRLSEIDLELRGPGAIYGLRQSGALDLKIAQLTNQKMIQKAKALAEAFVDRGESVVKYPVLADRVLHFRSVSKLN